MSNLHVIEILITLKWWSWWKLCDSLNREIQYLVKNMISATQIILCLWKYANQIIYFHIIKIFKSEITTIWYHDLKNVSFVYEPYETPQTQGDMYFIFVVFE